MKLQTTPNSIATLSNTGAANSFSIKATAKSFRILSDGLYSNKIRAIIRELSCNAYDSHVAAGKIDTPYDVRLPTPLDPVFSIRDYGVGLDHNEVTGLFTTFFESTKTDSNDFVGALGLGSKSPFSYTDNFTVTAIKNGIKGVYSAYINDDSIPSLVLLSSSESDEPNGVEIKFSVGSQSDFNQFMTEARNVYTFFSHRPVISGPSNFTFFDQEYTLRDILPGIHQRKAAYDSSSYAVMGNISYPIVANLPMQDVAAADKINRLLRDCRLELHFDLGELDFQPSREGLSYNKATVNAIVEKLDGLFAACFKQVSDTMASLSYWEQCLYYVENRNNPLLKDAFGQYVTQNKPEWYNVMNSGVIKVPSKDVTDCNVQISVYSRRGNQKNFKLISVAGALEHIVYIQTRTKIVINDTGKQGVSRAKRAFLSERKDTYMVLLSPLDKTKPMDMTKMTGLLKNPHKAAVFNLSELPELPKAEKKATEFYLYALRHSYSRSRRHSVTWERFTPDPTKKVIYVQMTGNSPETKMGNTTDIRRWVDECGIPGVKDTTIIGVNQKSMKHFKATYKNIQTLDDYMTEIVQKLPESFFLNLGKHNLQGLLNSLYNKHVKNKDGLYAKMCKKYDNGDTDSVSYEQLLQVCKAYRPGTNLLQYKEEAAADCRSIRLTYPLLEHCRYAPNLDVIDYINLVDERK